MNNEAQITELDGGVTSPRGFAAAGLHLGFRDDPQRLDTALVVSKVPNTTAAGMFTTNVFQAAPVQVSRQVATTGRAQAVLLNSGNANAATGSVGLEDARRSQELAAKALGLDAEEVFVGSTGVIGVKLDVTPFEEGMEELVAKLSDSSECATAAARAIMTTDTVHKEHAVEVEIDGVTVRIGAMSKGSGMIQPNMATMLCVVTTDAALEPQALQSALHQAVGASFNKITVDSDTSTNDSVFALANGAAGGSLIKNGSPQHELFTQALQKLCVWLARLMASDGEGASKLVTVNVSGAASELDADCAARTVANSPLVKTAIAGHDCNWGRIAAALGRSGAAFAQENVDIDILGMPVLRSGLPTGFSEEEALRRFEADEVVIDVNLGAGTCSTSMWTCDFTHDYISINADYRS